MNAELKITPELATARPRSAVSAGEGLVGLAGLLLWTAIARSYGMDGPLAALCALPACALPMILWALFVDKVHRLPSTGLDWAKAPRRWKDSLDDSFAKIAGLWATWAAIAAVYCLCRWYWEGQYLFSMQVFGVAAIPLLLLSVPYVLWIDRRLADPRDGSWHFGQLVAGRAHLADREMVYDHIRTWTIKAFFLAFMLSIVPGNWEQVIRADAAGVTADPIALATWLIGLMFMIDVSFATVGYVLTLKPLNAHIRSPNPYAAGWVAALICYPPFILMNEGGPLDYHQGTADYAAWLAGAPLAKLAIAVALVVLTAIYAWATVAFGVRFSNLTHRGILTHGPYAWTKHPAYVSKNLFWWLSTLPFLATTGDYKDAIRNTVLMAVVTGVYYWRARTEEKHLSADPAYRDYAAWMERSGPLSRLFRAMGTGRKAEPLAAE
jgi:protein-S-isoprenylcysteine O-methyltransferase Ste14